VASFSQKLNYRILNILDYALKLFELKEIGVKYI